MNQPWQSSLFMKVTTAQTGGSVTECLPTMSSPGFETGISQTTANSLCYWVTNKLKYNKIHVVDHFLPKFNFCDGVGRFLHKVLRFYSSPHSVYFIVTRVKSTKGDNPIIRMNSIL
jgi:hypothetical protein